MTEQTPSTFWEERYASSQQVWSGRVNAAVVTVAAELPPGRALDLGCGEGGDAMWLAERGWHVTGVDLSPTAIARARSAAAILGVADRADLVADDLATWTTDRHFDLVTASFLQSPVELPRERLLRRGAELVAPGGRLLIVGHAAPPPWADPGHAEGMVFPTPEGDLAALELEPGAWDLLIVDTLERQVTRPDGEHAALRDAVVLVQRRA